MADVQTVEVRHGALAAIDSDRVVASDHADGKVVRLAGINSVCNAGSCASACVMEDRRLRGSREGRRLLLRRGAPHWSSAEA